MVFKKCEMITLTSRTSLPCGSRLMSWRINRNSLPCGSRLTSWRISRNCLACYSRLTSWWTRGCFFPSSSGSFTSFSFVRNWSGYFGTIGLKVFVSVANMKKHFSTYWASRWIPLSLARCGWNVKKTWMINAYVFFCALRFYCANNSKPSNIFGKKLFRSSINWIQSWENWVHTLIIERQFWFRFCCRVFQRNDFLVAFSQVVSQ